MDLGIVNMMHIAGLLYSPSAQVGRQSGIKSRTKEKLPVTGQAACGSLEEKEVNAFIYQKSRYRANNYK